MKIVVPVNLAERSYEIHIGQHIVETLGELLSKKIAGRSVLVVTDAHVGPLYAEETKRSLESAGFAVTIETVPAGESTKSLSSASKLLDRLVQTRADRKSAVVALGGGVVGDLAGFVAAIFARGIAFVQVPTTLLAMVDASVGGKVAVDHPRAKNMIGAFHQPSLVLCDLSCLETLPMRQYRCGLAEAVKHGVILDADLFEFIEKNCERIIERKPQVIGHLVERSCRIKADVVRQDEHETLGLRSALNYGHTFAHAFETAGGYNRLGHGEAVSIGMICAGLLARHLSMVDANFERRQLVLWEKLGLPTRLPKDLLEHDLIGIMHSDKKTLAGSLRFVLPTQIGHVELVEGIDESLVEAVLREAATSPSPNAIA